MTPHLALSAALWLGVLGCEDVRDGAAKRVAERVIAASGRQGSVVIDRENGSITVTMGRASTPAGWPEDVPIDPSAERARIRPAGQGARSLVITSADPVPALARYYRDELRARGWGISEAAEKRPGFRAQKGERRLAARFHRRSRGDGTRVEIELAHEKNRAG